MCDGCQNLKVNKSYLQPQPHIPRLLGVLDFATACHPMALVVSAVSSCRLFHHRRCSRCPLRSSVHVHWSGEPHQTLACRWCCFHLFGIHVVDQIATVSIASDQMTDRSVAGDEDAEWKKPLQRSVRHFPAFLQNKTEINWNQPTETNKCWYRDVKKSKELFTCKQKEHRVHKHRWQQPFPFHLLVRLLRPFAPSMRRNTSHTCTTRETSSKFYAVERCKQNVVSKQT